VQKPARTRGLKLKSELTHETSNQAVDLKIQLSRVSSGFNLIGLYVTNAVFSKEGNGLVVVILS